MSLELAVAQFNGEDTAVKRYAAAKERGDAPWMREVGFVEHHHGGRLVLRGVFAGHYLDVDESDHVSQKGAGIGAAAGGIVGILLGPPGIAVGLLVGGIAGAELGPPTDTEPEADAEELAERLRATVPRSSSAIVLIASPAEANEMFAALGEDAKSVRRTLTADEAAALDASLRAAPPAASERS
ncbi:MAG TPA: DUF1269 domain-containing protein [Solirubrobacteraceae bacterium]|jgi:uncharacterized membrane protein|nr:DUF1269 domain-containing protein [Solirubrobacteraceae bacterium]